MPHLSPNEIDEGMREWEGSRKDLLVQAIGMCRPHITNQKLHARILVNGEDQIELIVNGSMLSNHSVLQLVERIMGRAICVTISMNTQRESSHVIQAIWKNMCIGDEDLIAIHEGFDVLAIQLN